MGKTLLKECPRCLRPNFMDVDAKYFICPGCGARVEIQPEDVEKSVLGIPQVEPKATHGKKSGMSPVFYIVVFTIIIGVCYVMYNDSLRNKFLSFINTNGNAVEGGSVGTSDEKTSFLSKFNKDFVIEAGSINYVLKYDFSKEEFILGYISSNSANSYTFKNISVSNKNEANITDDTINLKLTFESDNLLVVNVNRSNGDSAINSLDGKRFNKKSS